MKIGIDARFYRSSTAGLGFYTQGLLHQLSLVDQDNEYVIFITPEDEAEYDIKAKNFKKVITPIVHYSISEQTRFLSLLNSYNFDLVHFLNFNHPIFYRKPFVVTIHDLTMLLFPVGRSQKSFIRKIAFEQVLKSASGNSSRSIAISKYTKEDMVKHFGTDSSKMDVVYNGIDHDKYHNNFSEDSINKFKEKYALSKPYLLFVSQWRPHKGLPNLIKAFEILKSKYKIKHSLVITGKANKDFPDIPDSINNSKYKKDIFTPGFVPNEDLPLFYHNAKSFIFPSVYEGFGLGSIEAMACGAPVISSDRSCMPEVFSDAAVYFDPENIPNMAKTIYQTIIDDKKLKYLSQKGLKHSQEFSWEKAAKETLDVYKKSIK